MVPTNRRSHKGQHGQTLLEFALVAPLMLVFLLGLVDFGIAIDRRLVLDHAVREGARYASVGGNAVNGNTEADDVLLYVQRQSQGIVDLTAGPEDNGYAHICYDGEGGVQVGISYTYSFVTGFTDIFDLDIGNIPINARASARIEQPLQGVVEDCPA